MGKQGHKSQRGVPETDWGEPKTEAVFLKLTKTGLHLLDAMAKRCGGSRAEFLERAVREGLAFSKFRQEDRYSTVAFLENLLSLRRDELKADLPPDRERAIQLQIIELEDLIEKLSF